MTAYIDVNLDPLGHYKHVDIGTLTDSLGMLPGWVMNPDYDGIPLRQALDEQYGFGLHEMIGGEVDASGIYRYPEDPDLYPLLEIKRGEETFYQYPYAIVAIRGPEGVFVTRMD